MFSAYTHIHRLLTTMFVTGVILASAAITTPAVQDLVDLRTVISAAARTIGDPTNPNLGWGIGFGSRDGMGTADLVNNITGSVLRINFQVNTNKTSWLLPNNVTTPATNATVPSLVTPTLPLTTSLAVPSTVPTSLINATTDLSTPYIDYVSAIPDLSTSLTTLGRAYHREMNLPVSQSIQGLQQSLNTLQTNMLQSNLISSQAILRTIRASNSLEDAQVAWGRFLNLPGRKGASGSTDFESTSGTGLGDTASGLGKRQDGKTMRPPLVQGSYYTHEQLWGGKAKRTYTGVERRARVVNVDAENGRVRRPFVV